MTLPARKPAGYDASEKRSVKKGLFRKCDGCGDTQTTEVFAENLEVCPACGHHHKLSAEGYRRLLLDTGTLSAWASDLTSADPLRFRDGRSYPERVESAERSSRSKEAVEVGLGSLDAIPIAYGAFVFNFMGGSMGSVVGEKITVLFERAREQKLPVVLLQASGGARMQEGILSLMQMAKTVAALTRFRNDGQPFLSVLLNPTTGGVAASFALLGDVNIAEPGALIGFAGPRVIENTIRQSLPEGFQKSEFLYEHGMVDRIAPRHKLKSELAAILRHLRPRREAK